MAARGLSPIRLTLATSLPPMFKQDRVPMASGALWELAAEESLALHRLMQVLYPRRLPARIEMHARCPLSPSNLHQHLLHHRPMHVGQAALDAVVIVSEPRVIDA